MDAPVPSSTPPQDPEYHFQTAPKPREPPTLFNVTAPPHDGLGFAVAAVGAIETGV